MERETMNYKPKLNTGPVVEKGEFKFAAIGLDHGHIYGMCSSLIHAGAELTKVYDPDPEKVKGFCSKFEGVEAVASEEDILNDDSIRLVAGAAVTSERCALGLRVMDHGKDYFTDKAPFTTMEQLESAKQKVKETGRKYMVFYSERIADKGAIFAGQLIEEGAIGRVLQVIGTGPHQLRSHTRPEWFFIKEKYGGILCDIGSHQIEQFLFFTGAKDAEVVSSRIANYNHKEKYPELDDFGDATLTADNNATCYFRVDWFTPDGLGTWGDGRVLILGTEGYIEVRKNIDIGRDPAGNQLYLVNQQGTKLFSVNEDIDFPFFREFILDCIHHTENAMTQEHAFKAAELSLMAQNKAVQVE